MPINRQKPCTEVNELAGTPKSKSRYNKRVRERERDREQVSGLWARSYLIWVRVCALILLHRSTSQENVYLISSIELFSSFGQVERIISMSLREELGLNRFPSIDVNSTTFPNEMHCK